MINDLPFRWHKSRVGYVRVKRARSEVDGSFLMFFYQEQPDVRLDLKFLRIRSAMKALPLPRRARSWRPSAVATERQIAEAAGDERPRARAEPGQRWSVIKEDV